MLIFSACRSVHSIVKVHGLRAFARSRPFRRSRRAEFMPSVFYASGVSFGLLPSALRNAFYSGSLPTFAVCVSGFACLLTFKSISHFRLFVKWEFRSFRFWLESKHCRSLDVSDYSTFGAVCQGLFSSVRAMPSPAFTSSQCRSAFRCPAVVYRLSE